MSVRRAVTASAAMLVSAVLLAVPASHAEAGCGGVQRVLPKRHITENRAPLIVGDSVLLGAMPEVAREGFEVNARGCRGWGEGVAYLRARRHAHTLPRLVVMQLGTNWSITVADIRKALDVTGKRRVLAILTPREVGGYGGSDARSVRAAGKRYPEQVVVLDWVKHTRYKSQWFAPDGIHLSFSGISGLARFLRGATQYADGMPATDRGDAGT